MNFQDFRQNIKSPNLYVVVSNRLNITLYLLFFLTFFPKMHYNRTVPPYP